MPGFQSITAVAATLHADDETPLDLQRRGWRMAMERRDAVFPSVELLQTTHLNDERVQLVSSIQGPPYSSQEAHKVRKKDVPSTPATGDAGA
jgi:hypothetical protein